MARKNKSRGLTPAQAVEENECEHGTEVRERWGNEVADASNKKVAGMFATQWEAAQQLQADILTQLGVALVIGDPAGLGAQQLVDMRALAQAVLSRGALLPRALLRPGRHVPGRRALPRELRRGLARRVPVFGRRRARQTFARFFYYCSKLFCDALFTHSFCSPYYHESD